MNILLALLSPVYAGQLLGTGILADGAFSGQSDFRIRYRMMNRLEPNFEKTHPYLHDYIEQIERLNLLVSKPKYSLGVQIDQVGLYLNKYILDDELKYSWQLYDDSVRAPSKDFLVVPEKAFYLYKGKNVEMGLGDVYASFGRGIVLNIVKNTDLDLDTSIRGTKAIVSSDMVELTMVSGVSNKQQLARLNPNVGVNQDIPHMISGSQLMLYGLADGQLTFGFHGMLGRFGRSEDNLLPAVARYDEGVDVTAGGVGLEIADFAGGDWYFELDSFHYFADEMIGEYETEAEKIAASRGFTAYGSSSLYFGSHVVTIEAKASKNGEKINSFTANDNWEVASAPSLEYERVITEDSAAAVNSNDIIGTRIRYEIPVKPNVFSPYVAVGILKDDDTTGLHFNDVPEVIVHPLAGFQWQQNGRLAVLNTGFRRDTRVSGNTYDQLIHMDGEFSTPLFGAEGLEINVSMWQFTWGDDDHHDFFEMQNAYVWRHGEHWDFTLYQDWSNNLQIQSRGNLNDELYAAFEAKWKPDDLSYFALLVGAYKAGIRCSGGQCRNLPGFEGMEFVYNQRF